MNWKEKSDKQPKRIRTPSALMVTAIALCVLAGIVLAENDNLSINVDIAQNVTDIMGATYENSIENASFGITIPQNKELLKMSEKKRICSLMPLP